MNIKEDERLLVLENIEFLKKTAINFLDKQFSTLEIKYRNKINAKVFDESDKDEIKQFLKVEFHNLRENKKTFRGNELTPFKTISISNNQFSYDINEFLQDAKRTQLVNSIYPVIEKQIKNVTPASYLDWINRISLTSELVYIKHKISEDCNTTIDYYPFKSLEVKKCFDIYIKQIDNKPHLDYSYLFQRLKTLELIENISHKTIINWLNNNDYIDPQLFEKLDTDNQLVSFKKTNSQSRKTKFDLIFKDLI